MSSYIPTRKLHMISFTWSLLCCQVNAKVWRRSYMTHGVSFIKLDGFFLETVHVWLGKYHYGFEFIIKIKKIIIPYLTFFFRLGGACSHLAALLFKLEKGCRLDHNKENSSASWLCQWKKSRKRAKKDSNVPKVDAPFEGILKGYSNSDPVKLCTEKQDEMLRELKKLFPRQQFWPVSVWVLVTQTMIVIMMNVPTPPLSQRKAWFLNCSQVFSIHAVLIIQKKK